MATTASLEQQATVVLCDNDLRAAPRYDVTAASALRVATDAFATAGAGTRESNNNANSNHGLSTPTLPTSRGSVANIAKTHASFIIVAVTENRAREIGASGVATTARLCTCVLTSLSNVMVLYTQAFAQLTWSRRTSCCSGASSTHTRTPRQCRYSTRTRYE